MGWEKTLGIGIVLYLAIALPLHALNEQAVLECEEACSKEGFNAVISAIGTVNGIECRCFNSYGREEKLVLISKQA